MDKLFLGKKFLSQLLVMIFFVSGCMPSDVPTSQNLNQSNIGGTTRGSGAGAGSDGIGEGTSLPPRVEIRHLIEPNLSTDLTYTSGTGYAGGGSYVRKLTLPKNFAGRLYVAGINIGTLADRFVRVRFKFGMGLEPVTIPATVTQAPGITPQTQISVLVLDLRSEPFRNIRLPYDLFDYTDYAPGETPVQDNRDSGLYCRGLKIQDDPTFDGVGACDGLQSNSSQPEEQCLYAYAKVLDQGLVKVSGSVKVPLTPSLPQVKSVTGSNYFMDFMSAALKKPLLDTMPTAASNIAGSYTFSIAASSSATDSIAVKFENVPPKTIWDAATILGAQYYYRGPYRLVNTSEWQFKFADLDGEKRLFREGSWVDYPVYMTSPLADDSQTAPTQDRLYYNSYLFPLATKIRLSTNVTHLSSTTSDGVRAETTLSAAGTTDWMDGATARAQSKNYDLEHIGSCNVSATLEIIAKDDNLNDYVVASSKDVKLQLVRPTQYRTDTGNEVLYTNFKSCSTNSACGSSECCFNNRCWDESLVSQCLDNNSTTGNRNIGEVCSTDVDCTSLCCNRSTGLCAPHNTILSPPVLCSKPIGDYCIAKEWCAKSTVTKYLIIKTAPNPITGAPTCMLYTYYEQVYGDCLNGTCSPPTQEAPPAFDPADPNACDNAVPAPSF